MKKFMGLFVVIQLFVLGVVIMGVGFLGTKIVANYSQVTQQKEVVIERVEKISKESEENGKRIKQMVAEQEQRVRENVERMKAQVKK